MTKATEPSKQLEAQPALVETSSTAELSTTSSSQQHTPTLLKSHLKTLRMPTMLRESTTVARQISEHNGSYELYLQQLCELEVQQRLAGALLDRLTHHVHIIAIEGDSFRLKTSVKKNRKKSEKPSQTPKGGDPPAQKA